MKQVLTGFHINLNSLDFYYNFASYIFVIFIDFFHFNFNFNFNFH